MKTGDYCVFHKDKALPAPEAQETTVEQVAQAEVTTTTPPPIAGLGTSTTASSTAEVSFAVASKPKEPETKPYPFKDGNVNENTAIRMIAMVKPGCPMDSNPEILRRDGTSVPNPRYTGEPNCQQVYKINEQGRWDVQRCIELGHDPYYTVFRKTVVEDTVGQDGYVIDTKQRVLREKRLNIDQVSDNPRHTNRTEVALALARGSVLLQGFLCTCSLWPEAHHHQVPCEFRNCSVPWQIDTRYGRYCSERHARLVAADFKRMILPIGGDPYTEDQATEERNQMLETINIRKGG
jgi:hypothetical protein